MTFQVRERHSLYPRTLAYLTLNALGITLTRAYAPQGTRGYAGTDRLLRLYEAFKAAPMGSKERRHLRRAVEREARRRVAARDGK